MIEKIMKAVKSGNKKRGRNITIGAVVGMLLSCTVAMGADVVGLEITQDTSEIKFSKDTIPFDPNDPEDINNPYPENTWIQEGEKNIYTNTTTIFGTAASTSDSGYGLKLSGDLGEVSFKNNGIVSGDSSSYNACGIILETNNDDVIGSIINIGSISGNNESSDSGKSGSGIANFRGKIGIVTNTGSILGKGKNSGYGIVNGNPYGGQGNIGTLTNVGLILGTGTSSYGYGIQNKTGSKIEIITNRGLISGTGTSGYGIDGNIGAMTNIGLISGTGTTSSASGISLSGSVDNITNIGSILGEGTGGSTFGISGLGNTSIANAGLISGRGNSSASGIGISQNMEAVTNTGIIYGDKHGLDDTAYKNIDKAINYGIIANGSNNRVVNNMTIINNPDNLGKQNLLNYGLIIKNGTTIDSTIADTEGNPIDVIVGYDADGTPITKSMYIKNNLNTDGSGSYTGNDENNSILNALKDTYEVTGTDDKVSGSIINAYEEAIIFDTNGGSLSLSETTVNGGVKTGTFAIKGSVKTDNLTLENGTIINGNVDMGAEADTLTIGNGSQINGTLDGGDTTSEDTLNFGVVSNLNAIAASNNEEIRVLHDISNFENINVNSNVTFYEKTADADGKIKDLAVTGVKDLTIGKNGVLTLRIDTSTGTATHALAGNTGTIKSVDGGKLLLALNGAGKSTKISFGSLELDKSLITGYEGEYQKDVTFETTSALHSVKRTSGTNEVEVEAKKNLPLGPSGSGDSSDDLSYEKLNKIYQSLINEIGNFNVENDDNGKSMSLFLSYLNDIYAGNPYSYSSELSRKSVGMFRDIVTDNQFKANTGKWMIYGGLTHVDGGTKDTYYGKGYYTYDIGSSDMDADTKITGAYMLGEYGISDTLSSGVVIGGNKLKSDLSNGSKVDGSALYLGAYAKKYVGNLKVTAGAGFQYGDYDADRLAVNKVASDSAESVMKYSDNYNDITYDIYLNGRYSHNIGGNLFLEPYATLSYTYVDQDGANEGNKTLAIETDSKSFDYTVGKVGVDLKKVIPHEKGKSTLSAGVSYTKILDGADEEHITGRFKGGSDFDILVTHKNEHSIGLNAKYALELENGVILDIKGTYSVERDSHNGSGKNKTKGEWIVGAGLGYKF